jgi:hypothetical protein
MMGAFLFGSGRNQLSQDLAEVAAAEADTVAEAEVEEVIFKEDKAEDFKRTGYDAVES